MEWYKSLGEGQGSKAGVKATHCVVSMVLHHIPPDADGKSVYAVNKIQGHSQLQVGVGVRDRWVGLGAWKSGKGLIRLAPTWVGLYSRVCPHPLALGPSSVFRKGASLMVQV